MRAVEIARKLCPHGRSEYLQALEQGDALFKRFKITTPARMAMFLATIFEETDGLIVTEESMHYTHAARIREVWPHRFATDADAQPFVGQDQHLANFVYGGRGGNRGVLTMDGWNYRGRGPMQTTFRDDYIKYGKLAGADFVNDPDLLLTAEWALWPAVLEWDAKNCNAAADSGDFHKETVEINGGTTNWAERQRWLALVEPLCSAGVDMKPESAPAHPITPVAAAAVAAAGGSLSLPASSHHWEFSMSNASLYVALAVGAMCIAIGLSALLYARGRYVATVGTNFLSYFENNETLALSHIAVIVGGLGTGFKVVIDNLQALIGDSTFMGPLATIIPDPKIMATVMLSGAVLHLVHIPSVTPLPLKTDAAPAVAPAPAGS